MPCSAQNVVTAPRGASSGHRAIARRTRGSTLRYLSELTPQSQTTSVTTRTPRSVTDVLTQNCHPCPETSQRDAQDHPRSRGVYVDNIGLQPEEGGSSPLARGLLLVVLLAGEVDRIIPARAGFTSPRPSKRRPGRDHPRSRGVYLTQSRAAAGRKGSSPLARGLLVAQVVVRTADGIIPARAGFTITRSPRRSTVADHPRSRGVYAIRRRRWRICSRIIPARAGFTQGTRERRQGAPDHPRSRGVYRPRSRGCASAWGSSPLARGLPRRVGAAADGRGIIPARAGFTGPGTGSRRRARDHPRSRGVYGAGVTGNGNVLGSSPLARGLRIK